MNSLTEIGIEKQAQYLIDSVSHATYDLDGNPDTLTVFNKSFSDGTVKIILYFDTTIEGEISNVKLIDFDGDTIAQSNAVITKPQVESMYMAFKYRLIEEEVLVDEL